MKKIILTFSLLLMMAFGFTKIAQLEISNQQYRASLAQFGIYRAG